METYNHKITFPLQEPFPLEKAGKYCFSLMSKSETLDVFEMEDALFNTDSAVLLPNGVKPDAQGKQKTVNGLEMIVMTLEYAMSYPDKKLLIFGHTDTTGDNDYNLVLSRARAKSIYYLLTGNKTKWIETIESRNDPPLQSKGNRNLDIRSVLKWIDGRYGIECDPGSVNDHAADDKMREAIKGLRVGFRNENNNREIYGNAKDIFNSENAQTPSDGDDYWGWKFKENDENKSGWGIVFDIFMYYTGTNLTGLSDPKELLTEHCEQVKDLLDWSKIHKFAQDNDNAPFAAIGCGEERPLRNIEEANQNTQSRRRTEVFFFLEEEAKKIFLELPDETEVFPCFKGSSPSEHCSPGSDGSDLCPIYGKDINGKYKFEMQYIQDSPRDFYVFINTPSNEVNNCKDIYTLTNENETYKQTKTVCDDATLIDNKAAITFNELHMKDSFSLLVDPENQDDVYSLFSNVPFRELKLLSQYHPNEHEENPPDDSDDDEYIVEKVEKKRYE